METSGVLLDRSSYFEEQSSENGGNMRIRIIAVVSSLTVLVPLSTAHADVHTIKRHPEGMVKTSHTPLEILTFNVLATRATWDDRRAGIVDKIKETDPDIAGLQEAFESIRSDIEYDLQDDYTMVSFDAGMHDNPIIFRTDRFDVTDSGYVDGAFCGFMRTVNWVRLYDNRNREDIYFYNNHMCTDVGERELHSVALVELMDSHQRRTSAPAKAIAVGDLNSHRRSPNARYLLDGSPLFGEVSPLDLDDTWEAVYPRVAKPPTSDRDVSIDYILTPDSMNVLDASVGDHAGFSDHHPVTATIGSGDDIE
ncbi:endonuclease/exonuclease/phosphatase family protein [Rhodococcus sp. WMMA185]|uniref:endonuclease/exonuclease/phosphatase family protein n=1 Tax=Rhodococcus sp. WMMA185 TaxID=679318 RepID=UPI0018DB0094|nr:endonuclease/exonuclease/phosphatase family protein [Rhodococcus sp. WMMA185]